MVGDKMGNNIRGGLEPRGSLSSADGNIPRGKRGSRRGFRAALGLIVSTMLVAVGTVGVGVMPAHAAEEVVSDWVCAAYPHETTNFLIGNGKAQKFTIPKFGSTGLPGTFKQIEITQSADLKSEGSLAFYHNETTEVTLTASYDIWMNLPPYPAEKKWTDDSKKEIHDNYSLVVYHELEQEGATPDKPRTNVVVPEATASTSASATSADAAVWDGEGSYSVFMQAKASLSAGDSGGNFAMSIQTSAAAKVCYRYTYDLPETTPKIDLVKNGEGDDVTPVGAMIRICGWSSAG